MKTYPLLCLSLLVLGGCRAKTALPGLENDPVALPAAPEITPETVIQSPFQVTARANQNEFEAGKPIELEIEIKNISEKPADLHFSSGQSFDFSAVRTGDKDFVWSYGMNKRFIQALRTVTLEAGKSLDFKTTWNNVKEGTYIMGARITANGGLEAAPFQIIVK